VFTKTIIALAIALGSVSGAMAAIKPHGGNPAFDVYTGGRYVGSDPDALVRLQLKRSPGGVY